MSDRILPRYPIYIPSKGRAAIAMTGKVFVRDKVPFHFVVEPQEVAAYTVIWGADSVLSLPENNRGIVYARNWIKDHAVARGAEKHWQLDDDIMFFIRTHHGRRWYCSSALALSVAEDFTDQYDNVAITALNSANFIVPTNGGVPPFIANSRCYSVCLIRHEPAFRWRGRYNDDTDMTLQVLSAGHCTLLLNAWAMYTPTTMTQSGGQTDIYVNDGRLRMARELQRRWPYLVEIRRRFKHPQHVVNWRVFNTPLHRAENPPPMRVQEHTLALMQCKPVASAVLRRVIETMQEQEAITIAPAPEGFNPRTTPTAIGPISENPTP